MQSLRLRNKPLLYWLLCVILSLILARQRKQFTGIDYAVD